MLWCGEAISLSLTDALLRRCEEHSDEAIHDAA